MPTTFKQASRSSIGTGPVDVLTVPGGFTATVIGCNIANTTEYDTVSVDVYVTGADSVDTVYIKGLTISPNAAVKIITNGEKLILPQNNGIKIVSDLEDSVSAVISYVELS
jgi:hypothetical protein